jgi:hypothetical protein
MANHCNVSLRFGEVAPVFGANCRITTDAEITTRSTAMRSVSEMATDGLANDGLTGIFPNGLDRPLILRRLVHMVDQIILHGTPP